MANVWDWRSKLRSGARICASYGEERHERLLLAPLGEKRHPTRWVIATADWDLYDEDFEDADDIAVLGPHGGLPPELKTDLAAGHVFVRFDNDVLRGRRGELIQQGAELAKEIKGLEDVHGASTPRLEASTADDVLLGGWTAGKLPPHLSLVCLESRLELRRGQAVPHGLVLGYTLVEDRAVVQLKSGVLSAAVAGTTEAEEAADADSRVLPVQKDKSGRRKRLFTRTVEELEEDTFADWGIDGPRSMLFILSRMADGSQTPTQRHAWWRSILGLAAGDPGVDEHLFLAQVMEVALVNDQVAIQNSEAFELLSRRWQMWEAAYQTELRSAEAGDASGDWLAERDVFLGIERLGTGAIIMPELEEHVAAKLGARAAVLKERRKAREEAAAARGQPVSSGGGAAVAAESPATGKQRGRGGRGRG